MSERPPAPPDRFRREAWPAAGEPPARHGRPSGAQPPPRRPAPGLDRRRAAAARRHSVFVAVMKGLLPGLAVCLIAVFVFYSQGGFAPDLPEGIDFDPGEIDIAGTSLRMVSPLLTGLDNENRRFEVTAVTAVQDSDNPGLVNLDGINANMELADGGWLTLDAVGGVYDSDTNMLTLDDAIEVTTSTGYVARLNSAEVDFRQGEVTTGNPVVVYMDAGVITGNAMTLYPKHRRALFTDGVTMTINGDPGRGDGGP